MNLTLHLTNRCNLACTYCYVSKDKYADMDFDTAKQSIDLALKYSKKYIGVSFFGGEPLIKKDLIKTLIEYTKYLHKKTGITFSFNMTTNGILLDEQFIDYSLRENIFISISFDGIKKAHDLNRLKHDNQGSYDLILPNIQNLLYLCPYYACMQTVNINTLEYYFDSVQHLFDIGFKNIISTMNFKDSWSENHMDLLKKQYEKLADLYYEKTLKDDRFYFSPFDIKIDSYINSQKKVHSECDIGINQVSVGSDGFIYPCVQFVGDTDYIIGNVSNGFNFEKRNQLNQLSKSEKKQCDGCSIKNRCVSRCSCLCKQTTGSIDKISPALCNIERILIPVADQLAEKLYKKRSAIFLQKHYNKL
ncbi:MAG: radical SAM protein [Bacillota bacterium]|nr:radical SAM protein [Bacillota bacterium]